MLGKAEPRAPGEVHIRTSQQGDGQADVPCLTLRFSIWFLRHCTRRSADNCRANVTPRYAVLRFGSRVNLSFSPFPPHPRARV